MSLLNWPPSAPVNVNQTNDPKILLFFAPEFSSLKVSINVFMRFFFNRWSRSYVKGQIIRNGSSLTFSSPSRARALDFKFGLYRAWLSMCSSLVERNNLLQKMLNIWDFTHIMAKKLYQAWSSSSFGLIYFVLESRFGPSSTNNVILSGIAN